MLPIALAAEDADAREYRFLDLLEPARLIALLSKAKRLPFVEISRHVEAESLASQHGPVEPAPATKLQGEGLEKTHGMDVFEGGGLTPVPVPYRGRFLNPSSGDPDLGIDHAGERQGELPTAPGHHDLVGHDGTHGGGRQWSAVETRDGNLLRADDPVASPKPRPLNPFGGGEDRELLAAQIPDFTLGGPWLFSQKIDEALTRLSLEGVRFLALPGHVRGRRRFRRRRSVAAGGAPQDGGGDTDDDARPLQAAREQSGLSYGSVIYRRARVLP
jgi:hypothetical protein